MKIVRLFAGMGAIALSAAAFGQVAPGGVSQLPGSGSSGVSDQMGAHDNASDPNADRIYRGTRDAADREAAARARATEVRGAVAATAADIVAGRKIWDSKGALVGTVESADADGAVVVTEKGKVKVPLEAFGKNSRGLVFGVTKAQFDAMVGASSAPAG